MFKFIASAIINFLFVRETSHYENIDAQQTTYPSGKGYKRKAQTEYVIKQKIQSLPKVRVQYVIDGDTVIVVKGWRKVTIRLDSIDSPEDGQHWGDIATYGLIKLIGGRKVHLEEHGVDDYGRTLATIYVWHENKNEWLNVNERMIILGHAWILRGLYDHLPQTRQDKYIRMENWAKSKQVGLWHEENPTPPWEWRYKQGIKF